MASETSDRAALLFYRASLCVRCGRDQVTVDVPGVCETHGLRRIVLVLPLRDIYPEFPPAKVK